MSDGGAGMVYLASLGTPVEEVLALPNQATLRMGNAC